MQKHPLFFGAGDRTHIASQSALLVRQAHSHHFAKNSHLDCFLYAKCLLKLQVLSSVIEKTGDAKASPVFLVQATGLEPARR